MAAGEKSGNVRTDHTVLQWRRWIILDMHKIAVHKAIHNYILHTDLYIHTNPVTNKSQIVFVINVLSRAIFI